jgi:hypothetical protein
MFEKFRKEIWALIVILAVFLFLQALNGRYKVFQTGLYFDSWTHTFYDIDGVRYP